MLYRPVWLCTHTKLYFHLIITSHHRLCLFFGQFFGADAGTTPKSEKADVAVAMMQLVAECDVQVGLLNIYNLQQISVYDM